MTPPVLGLRPVRAARLRASKFPKPVICTFARIASAEVSSALFTEVSLTVRDGSRTPATMPTFSVVPPKTRMIRALYWDIPGESARYGHFLDPLPRRHYPSHPRNQVSGAGPRSRASESRSSSHQPSAFSDQQALTADR